MKKYIRIAILALVIILSGVFYWRYYFVFGEGIKAGNLNYFEKKGYVFKTWEGRIVQEGFQSPTAGALQSNEFRFSAKNDEVASKLERASGRFVELRYKEYLNAIPWRGASNFVVIEVVDVGENEHHKNSELPVNRD